VRHAWAVDGEAFVALVSAETQEDVDLPNRLVASDRRTDSNVDGKGQEWLSPDGITALREELVDALRDPDINTLVERALTLIDLATAEGTGIALARRLSADRRGV
jgi:hypothetical protein